MAKNDDREVDWAPRQIRKIKATLDRLGARLDNSWETIDQFGNKVFELDEATNSHIGALNKRISEMAKTIGDARVELDETARRSILSNSEDIRVLRGDHMAFQNRQVGFNEAIGERIDSLTNRVLELEKAIADADARMMNYPRRVVSQEPPHDFSYPVGVGKHPEMDRITGMAAVRREQYDRGVSAGRSETLLETENRVIQVLVRMGWNAESPAMETVLAAVRGE